MKYNLSLIIPTYNNPTFLNLVLTSIARQQLSDTLSAEQIEVLIADDGSTQATADLIQQHQINFPFALRHVWHEDNGFRAAAIRNLAVAHSKNEYLLFIDGDCLVANDFLINHQKLAETGYLVAGNRVLLSQNYTETVCATGDIAIVNANLCSATLARLSSKTNKLLHPLRTNANAAWRKRKQSDWRRPKSCNLAIWRSDFYRVNGFDESFSGWGHEDADLVIRLLHAGIRIKDGRFAAPVYHLWHKENDRSQEQTNQQRLQERLTQPQCISVVEGINKYDHQ